MITHREEPTREPVDASMSLLNEVMKRPLDPSYAEVAERKAAGLDTGSTWVRFAWVFVVAVLLGALITTSVATLRSPKDGVVRARTLLELRIERERQRLGTLQATTDEMSQRISKLQSDALSRSDPQLLASLEKYEVASGAVGVAGPGLRITLDDSVTARQNPDQADPASRVIASDVQEVVNALWASGAEAIAINGERLTALGAVRGVGLAIQVNLTSLLPPYVIDVIGSPDSLSARFSRTSASTRLQLLGEQYGIVSNVSAVERMQLPGERSMSLRTAVVHVQNDGASGSAATTSSATAPTNPAQEDRTP